jgi:hypothetical protein
MMDTLLFYYFVFNSYHQKVAYDPPILELKATFGLVSPEEFKPADLSPLWSVDVYKKMDSKMVPKPGPQVLSSYLRYRNG